MRTNAWRFFVAGMWLGLAAVSVRPVCAEDGDDTFFETKIRPVLADTCFRCHGGQKTNGKLRVDSRAALLQGGENGSAIAPGQPEESLLLKALRREEGVSAMPPDKPVPDAVIADFTTWIKAGAKWPAKVTAFRSERHWAFVAPRAMTPPRRVDRANNPVDQFLGQKTVVADKRTLIRRVTFDLTGLPPSPDAVAEFLADDSPDAFERLIERLLASPAYGEKWGRHWLDVVRYADTAGETADFPAPHAWRYRNYVINAFNADKPYDEFLREQIAGDLLAGQVANLPHERFAELITATGYLSISRRFGFDLDQDHFLTIDDTVDVLGKSVLGLSIACARCHDHKYDPISARDYYALYGIFESTRYPFPGCEKVKAPRDMVPLLPPDEMERVVKPHQQRLAEVDAELKRLNDAQAAARQQLKELSSQNMKVLAQGEFADGGSQALENGAAPASDKVTGNALDHIAVKAGEMLQLVILPRANHGADSTLVELDIADVGGAGRRWNVTADVVEDFLAGNPHADRYGHQATWCFFDLRNGPTLLREAIRDHEKHAGLNIWRSGETPLAWVNASDQPIKAWTLLPPKTFYLHPAPDGPVALAWLSPIDGIVRVSGRVADAHQAGGDGIGWRLEHVAGNLSEGLSRLIEPVPQLTELSRRQTELIASGPKVEVAYAVSDGKPQDTRIHERGDPKSLGDAVPRGFLSVLGEHTVPPNAGSGRLQLAEWLTSPDNPLTARVMVNRIWKHHFGTGLVKTPNDFGTRGEPPAHPDLLDWLAVRFMESGWSMKAMHRLILTSEAYRVAWTPSSERSDEGVQATRRRLSAEELRDAILAVSGDLDRSPGGPHPFPDEKTWGFTQHAPFAAVYEHDRRSVYLMLQRIKRHPFLALFDGPDTATSTPDRFTTTVPTQALFFLNDPFVHTKSQQLARRLLTGFTDDDARLDASFRLLFAREPAPEERESAKRFLADYPRELAEVSEAERPTQTWAAWLRVLLSSNEFLYID